MVFINFNDVVVEFSQIVIFELVRSCSPLSEIMIMLIAVDLIDRITEQIVDIVDASDECFRNGILWYL